MSNCTEKEKLEIELALLKRQKASLEAEISKLEKSIEELSKPKKDVPKINWNAALAEAIFREYIVDTKKLSQQTYEKYLGYLRTLRKKLETYDGFHLDKEIYQVWEEPKLLEIKKRYEESAKLQADNKRLHNVYSASLNNFTESIFKKGKSTGSSTGGLVVDE